jgi:hypothetical protein
MDEAMFAEFEDRAGVVEESPMEAPVSLADQLAGERKLREELERRIADLQAAREEAERSAGIRAELQKLGVAKVDLAFRAVKDDLKSASADETRSYLTRFVAENPELLPARITGGSGATSMNRGLVSGGVDLDKIRPGMSPEELERVRQEVARIAAQTLRGGY